MTTEREEVKKGGSIGTREELNRIQRERDKKGNTSSLLPSLHPKISETKTVSLDQPVESADRSLGPLPVNESFRMVQTAAQSSGCSNWRLPWRGS